LKTVQFQGGTAQEYDQGAFSPEDWQKMADLHAEEIRLRRGAGKKIDAAALINRNSVWLTGMFVQQDIGWIHHQMNEILKRTYPQKAS